MNLREQDLKIISNEFAEWQARLDLLGSLNLTDANIFSEFLIQDILNIAFDYKLINANQTKNNQPSVDLVDIHNKLAFQVTSTPKSKKIQSTIDSFIQHHLYEEYDELFIFILGKKQSKYPSLKTPNQIPFDSNKHIVDLKDLLKRISYLPTSKITDIKNIIAKEKILLIDKKEQSSKTNITRILQLKKKLQRDFLVRISPDARDKANFEPWIRFKYHNVILRDPDDKTFPEADLENDWIKAEFWDFYDRGIEFISHGGDAIFDKNGFWDILNYKEDSRRDNPEYTIKQFFVYPRLSFEDIVTYDMETDDYYGYPTIYCRFKFDRFPYQEINYGTPGVYEQRRWRDLFDNKKRKKENW